VTVPYLQYIFLSRICCQLRNKLYCNRRKFFSLSGPIAYRYKIILALLIEGYNSRIFKKVYTIDWLEAKKTVFVLQVLFFRTSLMFCYPLSHSLSQTVRRFQKEF